MASILYVNRLVEVGGRKWFSYVVGVEEPDQLGAPWSVVRGRAELAPGEAVVPQVLSRVTGTDLGGSVRIGDRRFEIVGLSTGTFSATHPITFIPAGDLADLLSLSGSDSYVLVRARLACRPSKGAPSTGSGGGLRRLSPHRACGGEAGRGP